MNIIIYILDACRRDYLGCYGYDKNTSPNIDILAQDSVVYNNAYSTSTWTKAAAASILSSQFPRSVQMKYAMDKFSPTESTLQSILKKNKYKTFAVSANVFFSPEFGFDDFDHFYNLQLDNEFLKAEGRAVDRAVSPEILDKLGVKEMYLPQSEDINKKIIDILEQNVKDNRFFICWSADTHSPFFVRSEESYFNNSRDDYIQSAGYINRKNLEKAKSLYCDMIRHNDESIGQLITYMKNKGIYEESMIIIAADHGELFGEHSFSLGNLVTGHGDRIYDEVIKIPLIIKYPDLRSRGEKVDSPVQLTDFMPTILSEIGLELPADIEGTPLQSEPLSDKAVFIESQMNPESEYNAAYIKEGKKLLISKIKLKFSKNPMSMLKNIVDFLLTPRKVLFDDLRMERIKSSSLLKKYMGEFLQIIQKADMKSENIDKKTAELDSKVVDRLKDLGYID